ncbi:hypothetical protein LJB42_003214 [Komagataella kurtzmanii]|nr:hypothetical protein LJB42_003214 [Komagataella kurtzmanii]
MSSALINRSLTTIRTELDFLRESEVISEGLFQQIIDQLPEKHTPGMAAASSIKTESVKQDNWEPSKEPPKEENSVPTPAPSVSAAPPYPTSLELAEALYDYTPQEKEDLALRVGDKIEVTDKLSSDWWRGKVNGTEGIFPANYVKLLGSRPSHSPPPVAQAQRYEYEPPLQSQPSGAPSTKYDYPVQQTQQYPGQNFGSPQPYPQQIVQTQPMVVQQPEQAQSGHGSQHFNRHAKKFGSKLGNAAIFGAGATIGSNIVNSIF